MAQHAAPKHSTPSRLRDEVDARLDDPRPTGADGPDDVDGDSSETSDAVAEGAAPSKAGDVGEEDGGQLAGETAPRQERRQPLASSEPVRASGKRRKVAGLIAAVAAVAVAGAVALGVAAAPSADLGEDGFPFGDDVPSDILESPVDFEALQLVNPDMYAWISVPEAPVDEPVMQNDFQDNLYLAFDFDGRSDTGGGIYSQQANAKDFTDPVTVLYGHTFQSNDSKFGALHKYEDAGFFEENPYFYIYTPDRVLAYEVVSAYGTGNEHILNTHDFSDPAQVQQYYDYVLNPTDAPYSNVREGARLKAGEDSIVQLSTCTRPSSTETRYVVTGKLVGEQPVS